MKKSLLVMIVFCGLLLSGTVSTSSALTIDLSTAVALYGEETSQSDIEAVILSYMLPSGLLYEATPGTTVFEEGSFAGSYSTTISGDNESAQMSATEV